MVQKLLNFGKNGQNCLVSAVSKIFSNFGLKQLTNEKSNQTEVWTCCSPHPSKPFLSSAFIENA